MIRLFREADVEGSLSGGPTDPIPQEVREKINEYADKYAFRVPSYGTNNFYDDEDLKHFLAGAEYGYSLALPRIKELEQENERLREALRIIRDGGYTGAYMIAHEALTKALAGKKGGEV